MGSNNLRKQYRLQNWIEAIRDQKASGLSIRQWCEQHHVTKYQFYYRQRAVRAAMADAVNEQNFQTGSLAGLTIPASSRALPSSKKVSTSAKPDFVEVPRNFAPASGGAVMRVRRGSVVLEVSNDASDRVLSLLREVILDAD